MKEPSAVVKAGQRVNVTVIEVDLERKRIALSLKTRPDLTPKPARAGDRTKPSQPSGVKANSGSGFNSGLFAAALDRLGPKKQ